MRAGGSKAKGNRFENQVYDEIRKLGYWVRKNKGSGNAEDNKGDLETYNLLIECKHHKKATPKLILNWMNKIYREAIAVDKYPILIVKENYKAPLVYFINTNGDLEDIGYDVWKNAALPLEKERIEFTSPPEIKKDAPWYIG